jgi:predicted AAA+ superfamily ATPase
MISRQLNLLKTLGKNTSSFLLGPRGTGKTTLANSFAQEVQRLGRAVISINLLSLSEQSRYTLHPELFRRDIQYQIDSSTKDLLIIVDEVQKVPAILDEVHYFLESPHKDRLQFLLTGSSGRKIKRGAANLLAGRAASLTLHPLAAMEVDVHLERALQYGTLPRFYLEPENPSLLLEAYVDSYLKEEIQSERLVRSLAPFHRFLTVAAQMNGKPINFSALGRDVGVSDQTARDYYLIMLDTYLAWELPAWTRSTRKQVRGASKFYLFDCGILNVLLGDSQARVLPGNRRHGSLFESYMITEFFRQRDYLRCRRGLYYWQSASGHEVDLVIDRGISRDPIAIEIKSSNDVAPTKLNSLRAFKREYPNARLVCISRAERSYNHDEVEVLPWKIAIQELLLGD